MKAGFYFHGKGLPHSFPVRQPPVLIYSFCFYSSPFNDLLIKWISETSFRKKPSVQAPENAAAAICFSVLYPIRPAL